MQTTVKSRPNHYEMLGLRPGANAEDIARAFAEKMRLAGTRPMIEVTQICTAYETLRDSDRRRAYDDALGLKPKAATRPRWNASPYMMSAAAVPAGPAKIKAAAPPTPRADDVFEPQPEPFVAGLAEGRGETRAQELLKRLEEQRRPEPRPDPQPKPMPEPRPEPRIARPIDTDHYLLRAVEERLEDGEAKPNGLNRTALIVGSLFVGVGAIGAWAGTSAGGNVQAAQSESRVTLALPKAKPVPMPNVEAADQEVAPDVQSELPARAAAAARRTWRAPAAVPSAPTEQPEQAVIEPAVADTAPVRVTDAKMPLPDAVVARTIGRIGYSCGQVASTSAVDGAAGVFRVTCTSGQSYQATPVGGRYRFRRLAGR